MPSISNNKKTKSKVKGTAGRPSDFHPKYASELIKHCEKGFSFESFAHKVGVTSRTLRNWRKYYGDFNEACERAETARLFFYEKQLNGFITGQSKGNIAALLFAMKTQYPEMYSQRRELDVSVTARKEDSHVVMTPLGPLSELTGEKLKEAARLAKAETARLTAQVKEIEESPNPFL